MKAILVTEINKNANKDFFKGNAIGEYVAKQLPLRYNGVVISNGGNYRDRTDLHLLDGFKDLVQPIFDSLTHKRGNEIIEHPTDENKYTYNVVEKTTEEVQSEIIANASTEQEHLIQERMKEIFLSELQTENDTSTLLANQSLYPLWQSGINVIAGQKLQHFNSENELVLWEVITSHATQEDWQPKDVPALFKRVAFEDEILEWVQPTGAHDAYQVGDTVIFNTQTWICTVANNVWMPGVYGWETFNRKAR